MTPTNYTLWREACLTAIDQANEAGGRLSVAAQALAWKGWEHDGPAFLDYFTQRLAYLATSPRPDGNTVCWENGKCFFGNPQTWLDSKRNHYCRTNKLTYCKYCGAYNGLENKTCMNCGEDHLYYA